jgi:hypothetical protein
MHVGRLIDRHTLEPDLEVRSMIEVEAGREVLVGLPVAGVLADEDPWNGLQQLALARDRSETEIGGTDASFGCGAGLADEISRSALHRDGIGLDAGLLGGQR